MKKIFKYHLPIIDSTISVKVPNFALFLHVGVQSDQIYFWAVADPKKEEIERKFVIVPTGGEIPDHECGSFYRGTCLTHDGQFVWHIFELKFKDPIGYLMPAL